MAGSSATVASYDTHISLVPSLTPRLRCDGSAINPCVTVGGDTLALTANETPVGVNSDEAEASPLFGGDGAAHPFRRGEIVISQAPPAK